jgi:hypothetical protein
VLLLLTILLLAVAAVEEHGLVEAAVQVDLEQEQVTQSLLETHIRLLLVEEVQVGV